MASDHPQLKLRFPPELKDRIEREAKDRGRTLNGEVVDRLERSFLLEQLVARMESHIDTLKDALTDNRALGFSLFSGLVKLLKIVETDKSAWSDHDAATVAGWHELVPELRGSFDLTVSEARRLISAARATRDEGIQEDLDNIEASLPPKRPIIAPEDVAEPKAKHKR